MLKKILRFQKNIRYSLFIAFLFSLSIISPPNTQAQLGDPLIETFYYQLYNYNFQSADSSLQKIHNRQGDNILAEMVSINFGYWMLITGKNTPEQNNALLEQIRSNIDNIENAESDDAIPQEILLQLILLYSFEARIHNRLDNRFSAIQSFRTSYLYFKQLQPCENSQCDIYNLVSGMYYVLTGFIRRDYPFIFYLAFEDELADVNRGLALLSQGINSNTLQIQIESRYFLMKLYSEVNEDPENSLIYTNQLVNLFPNNLTYRIYQLSLYEELGEKLEVTKAYNQLLIKMRDNKQLSEKQKTHLLEECHESIEIKND